MRKLETLREEAKLRVIHMAEQTNPTVRTFDGNAPRVEPRREITKLPAHIYKDRSRG